MILLDRLDEPCHCLAARDDFRAYTEARELFAAHSRTDPAIYRRQVRATFVWEFGGYF